LNGRPDGGASPEINQIFRETYFELRRIAHSRLYRNERLTLLDTTSLVHECYLRLSNAELPAFSSPSEMLGYSARVMRSVVVDFIRRRHAQCRGGDFQHTSLDGLEVGPMLPCEQEILDVDEAVQVLAQAAPRLAQVVEMKYFGGFTEPEIAESLGVTERTVRRDWEKARELLRVALGR
jgi:RNA polymerase sigma factor (TIGR02999 family)